MLQPIWNAGVYTKVIVLMACFILLANNHKQLDHKFDRIIYSLPVTKHGLLLSKYAMVVVWYILSALICNAAGAVYVLINQSSRYPVLESDGGRYNIIGTPPP